MKNSNGGLVNKQLKLCYSGASCNLGVSCKYYHSNQELEEAKEASQYRKIHMCRHIEQNRPCPKKTAKEECAFSHSKKEQEAALAREAKKGNRKIYMCKYIEQNIACPMKKSENCPFAHSKKELDEARTRNDKIGLTLLGLRTLGCSDEDSLKAIQITGATSLDEVWSHYPAIFPSSDPVSSQSKAKKPTSSSINSAWNASLPERQRKEEERKASERHTTKGYEKKEKEPEQKNASAEHSQESIVPRLCQNIKDMGSCPLIGCIYAHSEEELNSRLSSLKKTQLCTFFSEGKLCRNNIKGECWFAHGEHELRTGSQHVVPRPPSTIPPQTPSPTRLSPTFTPFTGGRMPPPSPESVVSPWNQNEKLLPSILGESEFPPLAKSYAHGEHELQPVGQHDLPQPPSPIPLRTPSPRSLSPNFTFFTEGRMPLPSPALKSETPWNQNTNLISLGESNTFQPLGSMLSLSLEMKGELIDITNLVDITNSEPLEQQVDTSEFQTSATNQQMGFRFVGLAGEEVPCLIPDNTNSHYILKQFLKDADLSNHFSLFKDKLGIINPSEILEYNEVERKEFDAIIAEILKLSERSRLRRHLECLKSRDQQNGCTDLAKKENIAAQSCAGIAGEEVPILIPDNKTPQTNAAEEVPCLIPDYTNSHYISKQFLKDSGAKKDHTAARTVEVVLESVLQSPSNIETIGELTIYKTKILGQGLGVNVFEGECRHKGPVAIKVITTRTHPNLEHAAEIEAQLLRKFLESADYHDNVVRYIHYEENKSIDEIYLAIELCTCSLYQVVEKKLPLLQADLRSKCKDAFIHQQKKVFDGEIGPGNWFGQLVGGIEFIHSKRVVHGDLRPHNILIKVSETGVMLKITDFGLSREVREKGDWTWSRDPAPGGGNWYAPEVMLPQGQKPRKTLAVDIFSLGCVFYYIITGEHPSFNFHEVDLGNIAELPEAGHLIGWMLRKWPEHRPTISEIKRHPFLMELAEKMDIIENAHNTTEQYKIQQHGMFSYHGRSWKLAIHPDVIRSVEKNCFYDPLSVQSLVRFIRNLRHNFFKSNQPLQTVLILKPATCKETDEIWYNNVIKEVTLQKEAAMKYFLVRFPSLIIELCEILYC